MAKKEDILELESRRKIFNFISQNPGAYMREMQNKLGMATGQLEYHLSYLETHGLIAWESVSNKKRYFVQDEVNYPDRKVLSLLRQEIPRRILLILIERGEKGFSELHKDFEISKSTLSFHLKKLTKHGMIEGRREGRKKVFKCIKPYKIAQVLVTYQDSFVDDAVDKFIDVWSEMKR